MSRQADSPFNPSTGDIEVGKQIPLNMSVNPLRARPARDAGLSAKDGRPCLNRKVVNYGSLDAWLRCNGMSAKCQKRGVGGETDLAENVHFPVIETYIH